MAETVTLILGDGIGPEIAEAAKNVIDATGAGLSWEKVTAGEPAVAVFGTPLPETVLHSIRKNKVALKGPVTTPVGTGFRSINVALRKELDLYANVRPAVNLPGIETRFKNVDILLVRESTEDLYAGIERQVDENTAESVKRITRKASERIARFAFELAHEKNRHKVTVVHKANIMKLSDGLFLACFRREASRWPGIEAEEMIVDAMCMKLVQTPEAYDVLLCPNLYGDIVSDLCAGLVGGLGVAPGANIGEEIAVFEPVHGSAPAIAGLHQANPLAMILSGVMMLEHLGRYREAGLIRQGVNQVLLEGKHLTADLGGDSTTEEFADAVIEKL